MTRVANSSKADESVGVRNLEFDPFAGSLIALQAGALPNSQSPAPDQRSLSMITRIWGCCEQNPNSKGTALRSQTGKGVWRVRAFASKRRLSPRTSIENNVRRTGNSSLPRRCCRFGLRREQGPDTARNFFAHFEGLSARGVGARCPPLRARRQMSLTVYVGVHHDFAVICETNSLVVSW